MENLKNIKDLKEFSQMILEVIQENEELKKFIEDLQTEKEDLENKCNDLEDHISKHLECKETNQTNKVMEVKELLLKNLDLNGISYLIEESITLEVSETRFCVEVSKELDVLEVSKIIKNEIINSFDAIVNDIEFETQQEKERINENY
jgi:hypothetical protein